MATDSADLQAAVSEQPLGHPALERLRERLIDGAPAETVITSYDRMHHRHSRS